MLIDMGKNDFKTAEKIYQAIQRNKERNSKKIISELEKQNFAVLDAPCDTTAHNLGNPIKKTEVE
jgi:hypothetical protein